jgi:hypothetical protein
LEFSFIHNLTNNTRASERGLRGMSAETHREPDYLSGMNQAEMRNISPAQAEMRGNKSELEEST